MNWRRHTISPNRPESLDRLFVTTIAHGRQGEPTEEGAGALYVIDGLGVKGRLEHRYAG